MKTLFLLHEQYGNYKECPGYTEIFKPMISSGYIDDYRVFIYQRYYRKALNCLVHEALKPIKKKKIVVFGCGGHTQKIRRFIQKLDICAFSDSNEALWGDTIDGILIIPPSKILDYATDILISSDTFEHEIEDLLVGLFGSKLRIYKIYNRRDFQLEAHKRVGEMLLKFAETYEPDLIMYTPTWPAWCIKYHYFIEVKKRIDTKIVSIFWDFKECMDTITDEIKFEQETLEYADFVIENSSLSRLKRMKEHIRPYEFYINTDKVHWHPTIFDPTLFQKKDIGKKYEIAIFGSAENDRKEWIEFLQHKYGNRFHHIGSLRKINNRISTTQYVECMNQTKIFVNTQTYKWRIQLKGKIREALSCGIFILEEDNEETRAYVPDGKGVVYFKNQIDLCQKIDYYLAHDKEREEIALAGYEWFHNNHSARNWTWEILNTLGLKSCIDA